MPQTPALAGGTGWLRGVGLTLPHPPACEPGLHCREHIRWPVGVKKSHISLCLQLCPCLQVPALRAAVLWGNSSCIAACSHSHLTGPQHQWSCSGPACASLGRHGQLVSMECAVRGKKKERLTLINTSNSALTPLWVFKLLNLSFLAFQKHTIMYNICLKKHWLPVLSSRVNMEKMNRRRYHSATEWI